MQFGYQDSAYIYSNMTSGAVWVKLGKMYLPNDSDVFISRSTASRDLMHRPPGGMTHIQTQHSAAALSPCSAERAALWGTYHSYGRPPVLDVKILRSFGGATVWARVDTFTRVNMTCETNSNSSITLGWGNRTVVFCGQLATQHACSGTGCKCCFLDMQMGC